MLLGSSNNVTGRVSDPLKVMHLEDSTRMQWHFLDETSNIAQKYHQHTIFRPYPRPCVITKCYLLSYLTKCCKIIEKMIFHDIVTFFLHSEANPPLHLQITSPSSTTDKLKHHQLKTNVINRQ